MRPRGTRKAEIYRAAARLFSTKGYKAASVRDLAESVGLEASSLYSHISSKEEILVDICRTCADHFERGMSEITASDSSTYTKVDTLIDLHLDIAYTRPISITVFNDEWRHLPAEELERFLTARKSYQRRFIALIEQGMQQGVFVQMSAKTVFFVLINSANWVHYYADKWRVSEYDGKKREIKRLIFGGLSQTSLG